MEQYKNKTEQNIQAALENELCMSALYRIFEKQAKREGYLQMAEIFAKTSGNELEHASILLELQNGCKRTDTMHNLETAVQKENKEFYNRFAKQAESDCFPETADLFRRLSEIEGVHKRRFGILLRNFSENKAFEKDESCFWVCRICGALHKSRYAPELCPVCGFPQSGFSLYAEDY